MKKSLLIAVTIFLTVVMVTIAILSEGFKNWEASTWFDAEETTVTKEALYSGAEVTEEEKTPVKKQYVEKVKYNSDMLKVRDMWTVSVTAYEMSEVADSSLVYNYVNGINPSLTIAENSGDAGDGGYMGASFVFNNKKYSYNVSTNTTDHTFDGTYWTLYSVILSAVCDTLGYDVAEIDWTNPQTSEVFLDDFMTDFLGFYDSGQSFVTLNNVSIYYEGVQSDVWYNVTFYNVCFLSAPEAKRGYDLVGFYSDIDLTQPYSYNYFSEQDTVYALYVEGEWTTWEKIVDFLDEWKVTIIVTVVTLAILGGLIAIAVKMRY